MNRGILNEQGQRTVYDYEQVYTIANNATSAGREQNRRVEITLINMQ